MDRNDNQESRIFIGNVAPETDPDLIEQHFLKHGKVMGVAVHKGFCFVQFSTPSEAKAAIEKEHGGLLLGKKIDVKQAKRNYAPPPPPLEGSGSEPSNFESGPAPPPDRDQPSRDDYHSGPRNFEEPSFRGRGRGRGRGNFDGPPRGRGNYDGPPRGRGRGRGGYNNDYYNQGPPAYDEPPQQMRNDPMIPMKINDCEIVCVSRNQRQFAERIEQRLKVIGMKVDVLFPNPKVDLNKIMGNIASRGVMFALLITPLNEDHNSVTLNVLQGQQQEHRNMPLEDAVGLMAQTFESGLDNPQPQIPPMYGGPASHAPMGGGPFAPRNNPSGMPEDVHTVFGFLMDARPLSVMEYDKLIKYLVKKREDMLRNEYGDNIPANLLTPPIGPPVDPATKSKQDEIQAKIMEILNKRKEPEPAPKAAIAPELSASLQKAIDSLIKTGPNLLNATASSGSYGAGPGPSSNTSAAGYGYQGSYGSRY